MSSSRRGVTMGRARISGAETGSDSKTLGQQAERFLETVAAASSSPHTLRALRGDMMFWKKHLGTLATMPTRELLRKKMTELRRVYASKSLARRIVSLRKFSEHQNWGMGELPKVRTEKSIPKPADGDQLVWALNAFVPASLLEIRNRALLEVLYSTGARISEVLQWKIKN